MEGGRGTERSKRTEGRGEKIDDLGIEGFAHRLGLNQIILLPYLIFSSIFTRISSYSHR